MLLPKYLYDKILNFLLIDLLCDSFNINFNNKYLIYKYLLYNHQIIQYCLVSKQWFNIISKNISHNLYCQDKLDDWIDTIYRNVESRFFNIINNDELSELSINQAIFNSYLLFKKYQEKVSKNPRYNNNDNNNSDGCTNRKYIIDYTMTKAGQYAQMNKKCIIDIIKIVESNEELPKNVEFKLNFYYNKNQEKDDTVRINFLSSLKQFFKIATVKEIKYLYPIKDLEYYELFNLDSIESLDCGHRGIIFDPTFISQFNFKPKLKKLSIAIPFHDILRESFKSEKSCSLYFDPEQQSIIDKVNIKTNYLHLQDKLSNSSVVDLTLINSCENQQNCLLEDELENIHFITECLNSLLTSPHCQIKYLKLKEIDFYDSILLSGLSKNTTIKSFEISSFTKSRLPFKKILHSVSLNQTIRHLKIGYVVVENIFKILLNTPSINLETFTSFYDPDSQYDELMELLNSKTCQIKEFHLIIFNKNYYKESFEFESFFNLKIKSISKFQNNIILKLFEFV